MMKELHGSIIAYNLVAQFRRQAAQLASVPPRRLSFSGVWLTFRHHLLYAPPQSFEQWRETYVAALISAANRKLPKTGRALVAILASHILDARNPPNSKNHSEQKTIKNPPIDQKVGGIGRKPLE